MRRSERENNHRRKKNLEVRFCLKTGQKHAERKRNEKEELTTKIDI